MDEEEITAYMREGAETYFSINPNHLYKIGRLITRQLRHGNKILIMGNGGSSIDAQHIAAEFVGKFEKDRRALPAIALTSNMSAVTAIGNDFGYDVAFERQIEAYAKSGDIIIAMSTSGNSVNVIRAVERANKMGCITIAMTGRSGGKLNSIAKHMIKIDSERTPIIQEAHVIVGHILSKIVEDELGGDEPALEK